MNTFNTLENGIVTYSMKFISEFNCNAWKANENQADTGYNEYNSNGCN